MVQKIVDLRPSLTRSSRAPERMPAPKKKPSLFGGKKSASLKTRRKRARILLAISFVLAIALLTYGVHWLSYMPRVRVQEISVRGATLQSPDDVSLYIRNQLDEGEQYFFARDSIFWYPKEELRAGVIRNFPRLKSVRMGLSGFFGTTLIVNVDEREAFATWCAETAGSGPDCFAMDDAGLVYAQSDAAGRPEIPYLFFGAIDPQNAIGSVYIPGKLQGTRDLLQRMREARFVPVSLRVIDDKDFTIELQNGFVIKAAFGQDIDTIVHNLELVAVSPALRGRERELEYIDLRFGNRVYYKFKGEDLPAEESSSEVTPENLQ